MNSKIAVDFPVIKIVSGFYPSYKNKFSVSDGARTVNSTKKQLYSSLFSKALRVVMCLEKPAKASQPIQALCIRYKCSPQRHPVSN